MELIDGINTELQGFINEPLPIEKTLKSLIISPTEKLQPPQKAWSVLDTQKDEFNVLGTLGNFSLIIGKAKSRKSFFINIAVATAINNDLLLDRFKSDLPPHKNRVLYFDTEQGKYHVQLALKRICEHVKIEEPKNLTVYGLRSKTPSERLDLIEHAVYNTENIGLIVIDGVKDLITSINDEEQATMMASKLLKWTEELDVHVITVLHQNKSDQNARGHIGTELINKAETVLSVTKDESDKEISIVEPQQCRNKEPQPFAFEIDDKGLPVIVDDYKSRTSKKKTIANRLIQLIEPEQYKVLLQVYKNGNSFSYTILRTQIKLSYEKLHKEPIGENKVKEFITHCKNNKWLTQEKEKAPYKIAEFIQPKV